MIRDIPPARASRSSAAIAAFSTVVEWYDFTLYLYFSTILSRVFFGPGKDSLLATLGRFRHRLSDCDRSGRWSSAILAIAMVVAR